MRPTFGESSMAGQRPFRLGLHRAQRLPIHVQQIVREPKPRLHLEFAGGDAAACGQVEVFAVLDNPAGHREIRVNLAACLLFGCLRHAMPKSVITILAENKSTEIC
jgi:hypothetical protein